jgi:hypothetical protein
VKIKKARHSINYTRMKKGFKQGDTARNLHFNWIFLGSVANGLKRNLGRKSSYLVTESIQARNDATLD